MKILILTPHYPPAVDGIGDYTALLAAELNRRGVEVTVLTGYDPLNPYAHTPPEGVAVHRVMPGWGWRSWGIMDQVIAETTPDWVIFQYVPHAYGSAGIAPVASLLPFHLRRQGIRVAVTVHEAYSPWFYTPKTWIISAFHRFQLYLLAIGARVMLVTTPFFTARLRRMIPWRTRDIHHLPVGSNLPVIPLAKGERATIRCKWGIDQDEYAVALFASGHDNVRHDIALRAIAQVARDIPLRILYLGGRDDRPGDPIGRWTRELGLGQRLIRTGFCTPKDFSRFLQCADACVLSFVKYGVSTRNTMLMTALAHGMPIVASHGFLTDARFVHGENLLLFPALDSAALAKELYSILTDHKLRSYLGGGARHMYNDFFAWPVIAGQLLTCLTKSAGQSNDYGGSICSLSSYRS